MKKFAYLIFVVAVLLRIWRLPELSSFNYDEARDAIAEKQIISGKFTMLGPESLIGDRQIYFGPLHYYLMTPVLKIFNFNPLGPYYFTAFIGGITAVIIYLTTRSFLAGIFYAVFPIAVIYNRWAWNPNTIPFFTSLSIYSLKKNNFFLAGVFLGLCFQLHFMAILAVWIVLVRWFQTGKQIRALLSAVIGWIVGITPIIIFDLRHDFLYTRAFFNALSVMTGNRTLTWHYFLWAIPVLCLLIAKIPKKISIMIIIFSLFGQMVWFTQQQPTVVTNPFYISQQAKIIAYDQRDEKTSFNIAAFINGDTRATSWRYFLELEKELPLGVSEYSVADHLYVISLGTAEEVLYNSTWEVASFKPVRVSKTWKLGGANIYRLEKI